ncbi:perlucin-like protein isoform X1 [Dreissena polymorpha]|uniref:C-type lectin domain-containing protein n=1 Tax=Dreissena polymorpha TaxID=45954 RepID=A0A9D4IJI8_DREPO|nr:perlucin-like protein isoform X1 [Dreissena polymorpha]XP_052230245.1 perlucin-like protein isoform X1 [Dreissena polymorpha]KAH3775354.1 hypothetical protein DPMN_176755 [Dreissena polymorpha]
MKPRITGLSIFALLSAILSVAKAVECPDNWITFHGHCYTFSINQTNWFHAAKTCHDLGAQLVIIETDVEDAFLKTTIQHLHAHDDPQTVGYWTGANDLDVEGHWVWGYPSDIVVRYTDWHAGEPNNNWAGKPEDCVVLWGQFNFGYQWNDQTCSNVDYHYICELGPGYELEVVG